jgi:hypothetical protein
MEPNIVVSPILLVLILYILCLVTYRYIHSSQTINGIARGTATSGMGNPIVWLPKDPHGHDVTLHWLWTPLVYKYNNASCDRPLPEGIPPVAMLVRGHCPVHTHTKDDKFYHSIEWEGNVLCGLYISCASYYYEGTILRADMRLQVTTGFSVSSK